MEAPDPRPGGEGTVLVPMGHGELIDRITILEIKAERIPDPEKLANVRRELATLRDVERMALDGTEALTILRAELRGTNEALWDVEDALRRHEAEGDLGAGFVELARRVFRLTDRRAATKREIDELTGSAMREEKHYAPYEGKGRSE